MLLLAASGVEREPLNAFIEDVLTFARMIHSTLHVAWLKAWVGCSMVFKSEFPHERKAHFPIQVTRQVKTV